MHDSGCRATGRTRLEVGGKTPDETPPTADSAPSFLVRGTASRAPSPIATPEAIGVRPLLPGSSAGNDSCVRLGHHKVGGHPSPSRSVRPVDGLPGGRALQFGRWGSHVKLFFLWVRHLGSMTGPRGKAVASRLRRFDENLTSRPTPPRDILRIPEAVISTPRGSSAE